MPYHVQAYSFLSIMCYVPISEICPATFIFFIPLGLLSLSELTITFIPSLSPVSLHATFLPPPLVYPGTFFFSFYFGWRIFGIALIFRNTNILRLKSYTIPPQKKINAKMNNGSPWRIRRREGIERIFEETVAEIFPNLMKNINPTPKKLNNT